MTDITGDSDDGSTAEEVMQVTAGSSEFLGLSGHKTDHEDWDEARHAVETHEDGLDAHEAMEDFPPATAGPGAFLAMTAEHTGHHGDHSHPTE